MVICFKTIDPSGELNKLYSILFYSILKLWSDVVDNFPARESFATQGNKNLLRLSFKCVLSMN